MLLKLIDKKTEAENVVTLTLESSTPLSPIAGQYFHYVLPHENADNRGTERWFTNSAAPSEGYIQISSRIDTEHGSSFKRTLNDLEIGDSIDADGPEGSFTIDDFSKHYVFVAGGIGITPFRSILIEARNKKQPLKATLLYGNRTHDIPFEDELDDIAQHNPDISIKYVIEPERINAELVNQYSSDSSECMIYISGPEPMVKSLDKELKSVGVDEKIIKLDDFPGYEGI
jgi:ferredoxin-NADP reductase